MMALNSRVASRYMARTAGSEDAQGLIEYLNMARVELLKWRAWSKGFDRVLQEAKADTEGLPEGYVWQTPFVDFWKPFDPIERRLISLANEIDDLGFDLDELKPFTDEATTFVDPPQGARIGDAIANPKFVTHPATNSSQIAYLEKDLLDWKRQFIRWLEEALRGLDRIIAKVRIQAQT